MKRTGVGRPVLSFGIIARNCALTVEQTLKSVRARAPDAEIVIVDTCSSDEGIDIFVPELPSGATREAVEARLVEAGLALIYFDKRQRELPAGLVDAYFEANARPNDNFLIRVGYPEGTTDANMDRVAAKAVTAIGIAGAGARVAAGEGTISICRRYADVWAQYKGPRGDWDEKMAWFDDAAAARNETLRLSTGDWFSWVDCDDQLTGPETTQALLKANGYWRPLAKTAIEPGEAKTGLDAKEITLTDFLGLMSAGDPPLECFTAPYLYRFKEGPEGLAGAADVWQDRERIVRNNGSWTWRGAGHEVLVPIEARPLKGGYLPTMLFVHRKKFTREDYLYTIHRHFNVLVGKYNEGRRTTGDCLYLENYSKLLCPDRRREFLEAAYTAATIPYDRYRVAVRRAAWAHEDGYYLDAIEALGAATSLLPEIPDAWFVGARVYLRAEQYAKAVEWYRRGINCRPGRLDSDVSPRDHQIGGRGELCWALFTLGRRALQAGDEASALQAFTDGIQAAREIAENPGAGPDLLEAQALMQLHNNAREACELGVSLKKLWDYLVRNDETERAAKIRDIIPHTMEDHPFSAALQSWAAKLDRHMTDPSAYRDFYEDDIATGMIPSSESLLTYEKTDERVRFLIDWVRVNKPNASVCEFGSFDGTSAIPLLRACPNISYTAVETQVSAGERLLERAKRLVSNPERVRVFRGLEHADGGEDARVEKYDVVVFYEVIEHVPNPVETIQRLLSNLKDDGVLFISTPWGAFDNGMPANMARRDPRGHVRAMTARELYEAAGVAGGRVVELGGTQGVAGWSATMHAIIKPAGARLYRKHPPLAFAVAGALWDWNASHVYATGIGASEETIVYLGRELAKESGRRVEVYGPIPAQARVLEEVRDSVAYWPREKFRRIPKDATVVVSRAPTMGKTLDAVVGTKLDKILWLQDAVYNDLNPEVAADYRKIVVLSEWHKETMAAQHRVPRAHMKVIPNFLLAEHFTNPPKRDRNHFVYASSPDRGLVELLMVWPKILEVYPAATLSILYGWEGCMKLGPTDPAWTTRYREVREAYLKLRNQSGIIERGRVSHAEMAREMMLAGAWTYSTRFLETFCSTAVKARAGGAVPVTSPIGALVESAACPQTRFVSIEVDFETYARNFVQALRGAVETSDEERAKMSREAIEQYRIEAVAPAWRELLAGKE